MFLVTALVHSQETSLREVPRSFFAALRLLTMVGATIASQQIVIDLVMPYALGRRRLRLRLGKATKSKLT